MINFLRRGLRFSLFVTRGWSRQILRRLRSNFFLWLDVNLFVDAAVSPSLEETQQLSRSFTSTTLRQGSYYQVSKDLKRPGIFLVARTLPVSFRLNFARAIALRLVTPRSYRLLMKLDAEGWISEVQSFSSVTRALPGNIHRASSQQGKQKRKRNWMVRDFHRAAVDSLSHKLVSLHPK